MKNTTVICIYLLSLAANLPRGDNVPCAPATSDDKEAVIAELLCIENYNKNLVLQRKGYDRLLRRVRGQDGSDCLAIRCIHPYKLSLELITEPKNIYIKVTSRGETTDYIKRSGEATPLDFTGIIGSMPRGVTAYGCQNSSMSYLRLVNKQVQKVKVTSIKLELRYADDTYKTIFEDTQEKLLTNGGSITLRAEKILTNTAFIKAAAGSCQDN